MKRNRRTGIPYGPQAREDFGNAILEAREARGLTRRQLSISTTLSETTIRSLEGGKFYDTTPNLSPYLIVALADALNLTISHLVDLSDTTYLGCGFSAGEFAAARDTIAVRKARQRRRANELTSATTASCSAPSVSAPPVAPRLVRDDEVPSNVELMKLVRQIVEDEDRLIVAELLKELVGAA